MLIAHFFDRIPIIFLLVGTIAIMVLFIEYLSFAHAGFLSKYWLLPWK